ncbi:MAG: helix-turn-helix domain-containing protein [Oscillospiraceae bacterium]
MNLHIGENIKQLRKNMNIGQDVLANTVCVSVQAVSKWETGQSLPDVGIIPDIAEFFGVSIDSLFFGEGTKTKSDKLSLPDDDKLYIVQVRNGEILDRDKWDRDLHIKLAVEDFKGTLNAEIWGSADIKGDVGGNVNAGNGVACQNVGGSVNAGDGVACGNVGGEINSGNSVACGNVGGGINCGDSVNCGNVSGGINAGDGVNCGNISGSVSANNSIRCGDISDCDRLSCETLYAKGSIKCGSIECGGDIHTEENLDGKFN